MSGQAVSVVQRAGAVKWLADDYDSAESRWRLYRVLLHDEAAVEHGADCVRGGSRMGDDDRDEPRVQHEAEHGDPVARMTLLGSRVALQRWQHAQQDRQHRDR